MCEGLEGHIPAIFHADGTVEIFIQCETCKGTGIFYSEPAVAHTGGKATLCTNCHGHAFSTFTFRLPTQINRLQNVTTVIVGEKKVSYGEFLWKATLMLPNIEEDLEIED